MLFANKLLRLRLPCLGCTYKFCLSSFRSGSDGAWLHGALFRQVFYFDLTILFDASQSTRHCFALSDIAKCAGGGGGRSRGFGYVRDPAMGFFIAGSTIRELNGVYKRVEQVRRREAEAEIDVLILYVHVLNLSCSPFHTHAHTHTWKVPSRIDHKFQLAYRKWPWNEPVSFACVLFLSVGLVCLYALSVFHYLCLMEKQTKFKNRTTWMGGISPW